LANVRHTPLPLGGMVTRQSGLHRQVVPNIVFMSSRRQGNAPP